MLLRNNERFRLGFSGALKPEKKWIREGPYLRQLQRFHQCKITHPVPRIML